MDDPLLRTLRCRNDHRPGVLGRLATALGAAGANIGDIRTIRVGRDHIVRDLDILVDDEAALLKTIDVVNQLEGVDLLEVIDEVHELHIDGKLEVRATHPVRTLHDLRRVYTPGVAEVVETIRRRPEEAYVYTIRGKTVAIVTNGTRVLGLGNVGPVAALPVMEGKAALLHQFVGLSAFPLVIAARDADTIVSTVQQLAQGFGAIQLEDIESPVCFEVEKRLVESLEMPVLHDDQHGTAVAVLAAAMTATMRAGLDLSRAQVGVVGLGAAGTAIARMLGEVSLHPILGFDPNPQAQARLRAVGGEPVSDMAELMARSDLVVAVTGRANLLTRSMIRRGQGIFALTNPQPEITVEDALAAGAAFAGDGRSVNNLLGFPGILRAAVDCRARRIAPSMYVAAARAIASFAREDELVPSPLRPEVHRGVARAVADAAQKAGVARVQVPTDYQLDAPFQPVRRDDGPYR
ncbi:MAG TPA: malic enzyme-like NAD(P)-binding protein [Myxococcota bacterium]|nr:malic enzyme-like NAD(P)-binding protein [Myxococcota bacterium]